MEAKTSELIKKSQEKRGAPGTLKAKIDGPITKAKVKALKNKPDATTLDKKQANFYLNMHGEETNLDESFEGMFGGTWARVAPTATQVGDYWDRGGLYHDHESVEEDCWPGYRQAGMKKKNGKTVPNCVPEEIDNDDETLEEAEHQGKKVTLNKPFRTPGGPKKFAVYTKNDKGNVVKVTFGDPNMEIKRDDPERRKSFRARHNCDNPGPKWKARYWSCKNW